MTPLLLLLSLISPASARADDRPAALAAALDAYFGQHEFAGTVLVAQRDEVVFARAVGLADREWDLPTTRETRYEVGSVTKPMVATLALLLVEEGQLALDDAVTAHVPEYPADPGDRITVHHLLSHTSGIPGYGHFENPREEVFRRKYTHAGYLAVFQDLPLLFEPGSGFAYSGFGYYLLGVVLERAGGAPLDELLHERVFEPAGMERSSLDTGLPIPQRARPYQYDYARARYRRGDDRDPTTAFSAGGVFSTTGDLWRFQRAFFGGRLVSVASVERMLQPVEADYGYGWIVRAMAVDDGRGSVPVQYHNGGITGYTANLLWFPEDEIAVVVLCNTRGYKDTGLPWVLAGIAHGDREHVDPQLAKRLYRVALSEGAARAIEVGERFREAPPATAPALDLSAELVGAAEYLLEYGHPAEAAALLEHDRVSSPRSAPTLALLGQARAELGERAAAAEAYRACLEVSPEYPGVREALEALAAELALPR